jgi:hypothetical protein
MNILTNRAARENPSAPVVVSVNGEICHIMGWSIINGKIRLLVETAGPKVVDDCKQLQ